MTSVLFKVVFATFLYFIYHEYRNIMSKEPVYVDLGGGHKVPINSINKPHAVVIDPKIHKPVSENFPDVESDAKAHDDRRAAEANAKEAVLDPLKHKPVINDFPDVEPDAKASEEARAKKND